MAHDVQRIAVRLHQSRHLPDVDIRLALLVAGVGEHERFRQIGAILVERPHQPRVLINDEKRQGRRLYARTPAYDVPLHSVVDVEASGV